MLIFSEFYFLHLNIYQNIMVFIASKNNKKNK